MKRIALRSLLLWWVPCFWLWMLLVGDWNRIEWIAGACAATVATTLGELARRVGGVPVRVSFERIRASAGTPLVVFADFGLLVYALVRPGTRGRYLERPFAAGPKTTPAGAAHRAWTVLLAGYSPNAYVVDVDPERDRALLHDLVPWRKSEEPA